MKWPVWNVASVRGELLSCRYNCSHCYLGTINCKVSGRWPHIHMYVHRETCILESCLASWAVLFLFRVSEFIADISKPAQYLRLYIELLYAKRAHGRVGTHQYRYASVHVHWVTEGGSAWVTSAEQPVEWTRLLVWATASGDLTESSVTNVQRARREPLKSVRCATIGSIAPATRPPIWGRKRGRNCRCRAVTVLLSSTCVKNRASATCCMSSSWLSRLIRSLYWSDVRIVRLAVSVLCSSTREFEWIPCGVPAPKLQRAPLEWQRARCTESDRIGSTRNARRYL